MADEKHMSLDELIKRDKEAGKKQNFKAGKFGKGFKDNKVHKKLGVKGKRVLAVEDTSTTGSSVLTAVEALTEAGAIVVGVAVVVDRGAGQKITDAGLKYVAVISLSELGLA